MTEESVKKKTNNKRKSLENNSSRKQNKKNTNINSSKSNKSFTKQSDKKTIEDNKRSFIIQLVIFIVLFIFVVILSFLVYQKSKIESSKQHANISIPITEEGSRFAFNINALNLSQTDEYVVKIVNYKDNVINKDNLTYNISIINPTNTIIQMTKDNGKKNYLTGKKEDIIENEKLGKSLKEEHYYHIKVVKAGKLKEKDLISVIIQN